MGEHDQGLHLGMQSTSGSCRMGNLSDTYGGEHLSGVEQPELGLGIFLSSSGLGITPGIAH